ncbi:hypothetical protein K501DRAFT_284789 [Backusella circina FSU 941]|nr:hypothetical protein K501DRAFT_284787 [Backusella circina FSU 941]KAI8884647.1 hypothetical protein K501DRAFT_284789 [Backusella circina FSU 941]
MNLIKQLFLFVFLGSLLVCSVESLRCNGGGSQTDSTNTARCCGSQVGSYNSGNGQCDIYPYPGEQQRVRGDTFARCCYNNRSPSIA